MPACKSHPRVDAIGYCSLCASFGCSRCLHRGADQRWYCLPCARKQNITLADRSEDAQPDKAGHLRLEVRYRDGRTLRGTSYNLVPNRDTFHLITVSGERVVVNFSNVKYVKQASGEEPSPTALRPAKRVPRHIRGQEIEVRFTDGEILKAYFKGQYHPDAPRFRVTPASGGEDVSILVERTATTAVHVGDHLAQQSLSDLINSPLRQALLKFYRQNSSLIAPIEMLAQRFRIPTSQLEAALKPFYLLKLVRKINTGNGERIEFLPPPNRKVHAFLREHAPKKRR